MCLSLETCEKIKETETNEPKCDQVEIDFPFDLSDLEGGVSFHVNGEVVPDADKTNRVTLRPKSSGATTGRAIEFRQLSKGFTKEVKLTR